MYKFLFIFVIQCYVHVVALQAQNLVPNPSFELLKQPPCRAITRTIPGDNISKYIYDWVSPTFGTSDIQLNIATAPNCPVDLSIYGQKAHSGTACAGMYTLGSSPRSSAASGIAPYREYLQVKLTKKLLVGKVYYVEFYASPLDVTIVPGLSCYNNNLGCYFSADSIHKVATGSPAEYGVFNFSPQVNETHILDKPNQWYKISGCFEAKEAAQFLTIGNFFTDSQTKYIELNKQGFGAYYLIDDVLVEETSLPTLPQLALGDRSLCPNQALTVQLLAFTTYRWQDGSTAQAYNIQQPGLYSVTATAGQCVVSDTFQVTQEALLRLPADTVLCKGVDFSLQPIEPLSATLAWNTGAQTPSLPITENGVYWVRFLSPGCSQVDSIRVSFVDCPGSIPNVFTPNDDGVNDTFSIKGIEFVPWQLEVVNRWGKPVYVSEHYKNDWTGKDLPSGLYYYSLSSSTINKRYKGWVELLRERD